MKRIALILLVTMSLAACKMDVEYCTAPHPHRGHVKFNFNWPTNITERPKHMDVMAVRVVRDIRYGFETTALATGNDSTRIIYSPDPEDTLSLVNPADSSHHVLHLRAGEYNMLAYNSAAEGFGFVPDSTMMTSYDLADAIISEPVTNTLDSLDQSFWSWRDRNPYSGYLMADDNMHIFSAMAKLDIPLDVAGDPLYTVTLTPRPLTQVVNIHFAMKPKESGIVVDDITCAISGVCRSMRLSTGEVIFRERTYKVLYKPTFSQESKYMGTYDVKGFVRVPGIVPNSTNSTSTGPGILQVNIHIHYTDNKGEVHYRTLEAGINLKNTLAATPSLKMRDDGNSAVQTAPEITLRIDDIMQLTHKNIESVPDVNIDKWVDHTPIGVDL